MDAAMLERFPKLLGDIGGTNVRLALQLAPDAPVTHILTLPLAQFSGAHEAVAHYLDQVGAAAGPLRPRSACLGVACPVLGDAIRMINAPWVFSIEGLRQALQLDELRVFNDFTVLAMALPALPSSDLLQMGGGAAMPGMTMGLIGAGTGLGVSALLPAPGGLWVPAAGEGGHVSLPASDEAEERLIAVLRARFGHVSAERVLSGSGLVVLYEAHAQLAGRPAEALRPADVTARGLSGQCALCEAALHSFCLFLGTIASNLAVTLGTQGGLYVGGGIVPRLGDFFVRSGFRPRFDSKGRYTAYLSRIPVFVIRSAYPALIGASRA
jgi:glucokinase